MTTRDQFVDRVKEILWSVNNGHLHKTDGRILINEAYTLFNPEVRKK